MIKINMMNKLIFYFFLFTFPGMTIMGQVNATELVRQQVVIQWGNGKPAGTVEVLHGEVAGMKISRGKGRIEGSKFVFRSEGENSLTLSFGPVITKEGSGATVITINDRENPFSFFLRDIHFNTPVFIPDYHVAVTHSDDDRSYREIERFIHDKGLISKLDKIEDEPEESFRDASARTRDQTVPTWLGISRDIRIFEVSPALEDAPRGADVITPRYSSEYQNGPEEGKSVHYSFVAGRGQGVEVNVTRRLEDGVLPILHSRHVDGEIEYHSVSLVSLERSPLNGRSPMGTDYLVADHFSAGHMFTPEQQEIANRRIEVFKAPASEQTVLFNRITARNTGKVPRYAWYKYPKPGRAWWESFEYRFDGNTGMSQLKDSGVFCLSKLNGKPLPEEEMAILVQPGDSVVFEFCIPHSPISAARAAELAKRSFDEVLAECRAFWQDKLDQAALIRLPEQRIEEMVQAGLLHLDLITYGKEPAGILAPNIGVYCPIGTESAPIIQFYCSMGLFDTAKRSLMYFLEKQHDDGLIQNFGGYMVETGAALWTMGEYFRYTNDVAWVEEVKNKLLKSCKYLLDWRENNMIDNLKGRGYGMIDGKVADPEDPYHQFMLNAYGYLGIKRTAEMLRSVDPADALQLEKEAASWKHDILVSFHDAMARSPVVPLGDGSWCPTVPPWTEMTGPRALFVEGGNFYSHGTFTVPDVLLGPLYLVFCELLEPNDPASLRMLKYHNEIFYMNNTVFSQPYYSRHNWLQLKLGMVKPFLKTYYNTFSALADRETYTFWEHLYQASPHKTHEEAWFLMETRWMLYMEEGQTLSLLAGIPREWLGNGQKLELQQVASYFGPVNLKVDSRLDEGYMEAEIACKTDRMPDRVQIRLPHPGYRKPTNVKGGTYDAGSETVLIENFNGQAYVRIDF
jgi:hypothetical protein